MSLFLFQAIYCYTSDGRGPCYAVEGQKVMLEWFRSYLVIIAKESETLRKTSTTLSAKPRFAIIFAIITK